MSGISEQLFLIEVLIDKVTFEPSFGTMPMKKQTFIMVHFGNFTALEIRPDAVGVVEQKEQSEKKRFIEFNCGKSYLFPCKPDDLISAMKNCPLQVTVGTKQSTTPIASTIIVWNSEFIQMVESSTESAGYITPAYMNKLFSLKNANSEEIGDIDIFIRLSCFGGSVQTNIQVISAKEPKDGSPGGGSRQFLFKGTTHATTFQCQKYGLGTSQELIPIAPLYNVASLEDLKSRPMEPLYAQPNEDTQSVIGSTFDLAFITNIPKLTQSQLSYISTATGYADIKSIRGRPEERRFLNIPAAINAELTPLVQVERISVDTSNYSKNFDELTVEEISKLLCKNPHCPAAKKFKEFGIGPLATGRGMGTVYPGPINPPVMYGMSHCNGRFENYGPYGVYTKPKNINEPFSPKDKLSQANSGVSSCTCVNSNKSKETAKGDSQPPLRLTGGAPGAKDEFPQPMVACKDLMEGFDKVLDAYKRAIGPCGQVTCPFAPNIVQNQCKQMCTGTAEADVCPVVDNLDAMSCVGPSHDKDDISACGMPSCPYNRMSIGTPTENKFAATQMKPACGDLHCPYTLQKLGLDVDCLELDVKALPKTCGYPKCTYNPEPELPPIHWDCPDPLPKGLCKNPNCPYLPKELKCFRRAKSPCGSPLCPYKQPPPCAIPGCPFEGPVPCPYPPTCPGQDPCPYQSPETNIPKCPYASSCPNPSSCPAARSCPFSPSAGTQPCPFNNPCAPPIKQDGTCANESCPLKSKLVDSMAQSTIPCSLGDVCPLSNPCPMMVCPLLNPCPLPPCPLTNPCLYGTPCPYSTCPPVICPATITPNLCQNKPCPLDPPQNPPEHPCSQGGGDGIIKDNACKDTATCDFLKSKPVVCATDTCPEQESKLKATKKKTGDECCEADVSCTSMTCLVQGRGGNLVCNMCEAVDVSTMKQGDKPKSQSKQDSSKQKEPNQKSSETQPIKVSTDDNVVSNGKQIKSNSNTAELQIKKAVAPTAVAAAPHKTRHGKKKKYRSDYVYGFGDQYPGVKIGHRDCIMPGYSIPANMGWLWNVYTPCLNMKPRRGWKPGAISKIIAERIRLHREQHGLEMLNTVNAKPSRTKKRGKSKGKYSAYASSSDETVAPKPTLQIKKRDGAYWITMNPLKDPLTLEENENPYMDCTPMQFKITKNKDKDDFKTCYCGDPSESESDSELDIEFTPPAGIIHPEKLKKKKNVVHIDTQYNKHDFEGILKSKKDKNKKDKKGKKGKKGKKSEKGSKPGKGKKK